MGSYSELKLGGDAVGRAGFKKKSRKDKPRGTSTLRRGDKGHNGMAFFGKADRRVLR